MAMPKEPVPRSYVRRMAFIMAMLSDGSTRTAAMMADEMKVSERSIYRDIARMRSEGAPVRGEAGVGYVLGGRHAR